MNKHKPLSLILVLIIGAFYFSSSANAYVNKSVEKEIKQAIADVEYNRPEKRKARRNAENILSYIGYGILGFIVVAVVYGLINPQAVNEDKDTEESNKNSEIENKRSELTALKFKISNNEKEKKTYHLCNYYIKLAEFYVDGVTVQKDIKKAKYFCDVAIYYANELYKGSKEKNIKELKSRKNKILGIKNINNEGSDSFISPKEITNMEVIIERETNDIIEQYTNSNNRVKTIKELSELYGRPEISIKSKLISNNIYKK